MVAGLADAALNDLALVPEPASCSPQLTAEVRQVPTADVPQFDPFEVVPDAFIRVQIRGVAGQLLQVEALGGTVGQELLHRLPAMDGGAVPDHQQLAGEMAQQMAEEAHHILPPQRVLPEVQQECPVGGDATNGREMIVGERDTQDGRVTARCIGANAARQEVEARFIYPDDSPSVSLGPLLSAGQRSSYQAWMAASLRWIARSIGCWGLQSMARRRRLTCAG